MEGGKLASCIAFCARRARHGNHEVTAQYLWQALHSLTALDAKSEPVPISLSEALEHRIELPKPDRPESTHSAAGPGPEAGRVNPFIPTGIEAATQTHDAVIRAAECTSIVEQMVQKTLAEQIAPIQAMVDQLLANQRCESDAPANDRVQDGRDDNQKMLGPTRASFDMTIGRMADGSSSHSRDHVRAQHKEERRRSRQAELIARLVG